LYRYEDIKGIHLELTSRCNASCPMCPRNVDGGRVNPNLPLTELSLDDIRRMFPDDFVARLTHLIACGNYGDAMVARDTLEIFEHFRRLNPSMYLGLHTNGSGRGGAWWSRLARSIDQCVFGIDGLEDTNHLYRRGTDWAAVMSSAEAYISAGGAAVWDFLVFKHNEHQVEAARELSRRLGFKEFRAKATERFLIDGKQVASRPVRDEDGRVEYEISPPSSGRYLNEAVGSMDALPDWGSYLQKTSIDCKAVGQSQIYASAEGLILPCCYISMLYPSSAPAGYGETWDLIRRLPGGKDDLDARRLPLRAILEGPFFQELVPGSWRPDEPGHKRSTECARTCGVYNSDKAQYPAPSPAA
jgi:MoaA/NifB/PqqE/SkfB family radical SAM enzyme